MTLVSTVAIFSWYRCRCRRVKEPPNCPQEDYNQRGMTVLSLFTSKVVAVTTNTSPRVAVSLSPPPTVGRSCQSDLPGRKSRCSSPTLLCSQWVAAPKEVRERVMFLTINQQVTPVISLALSAPFRWVEYQDSQTPQDGSLLVLLVVEAALGCQGRRHTKGALCNSELFSNVYCKEGLSPAHATYLWRLHRLVFSPCSWRTLRTIWTYAWSFLWC